MKKNLFLSISTFFIIVIIIFGCQKESFYPENDISVPVDQMHGSRNKCRLVLSDFDNGLGTEAYRYNNDGLVKEVKSDFAGSVYVYATMKYDRKGRLIKGTLSYDGIHYDDMVFEYEKNQLIREVTYEPGTTNMIDLVTNTYNKKGQIIRREDAYYDFYTTFKYDKEGNNTINELRYLSSNELVVRIVFRYKKHIKSPFTARPGITQSFWYINDVTSPLVPVEKDEYYGDGMGGEFLGYDEDPSKTVINPTAEHLAADRLIFDNTINLERYQYFVYENCRGKNESSVIASRPIPNLDQRAVDIAKLKMPLLRGAQLKKQLAERKLILQRLKNK